VSRSAVGPVGPAAGYAVSVLRVSPWAQSSAEAHQTRSIAVIVFCKPIVAVKSAAKWCSLCVHCADGRPADELCALCVCSLCGWKTSGRVVANESQLLQLQHAMFIIQIFDSIYYCDVIKFVFRCLCPPIFRDKVERVDGFLLILARASRFPDRFTKRQLCADSAV
jgi:hypothetical protein